MAWTTQLSTDPAIAERHWSSTSAPYPRPGRSHRGARPLCQLAQGVRSEPRVWTVRLCSCWPQSRWWRWCRRRRRRQRRHVLWQGILVAPPRARRLLARTANVVVRTITAHSDDDVPRRHQAHRNWNLECGVPRFGVRSLGIRRAGACTALHIDGIPGLAAAGCTHVLRKAAKLTDKQI